MHRFQTLPSRIFRYARLVLYLAPFAWVLAACQLLTPSPASEFPPASIQLTQAISTETPPASPTPPSAVVPSPTPLSVTSTSTLASNRWIAGDFHSHSFLTDGSQTEDDIVSHAFTQFGLDWMVASEHGGYFLRNPKGIHWDDLTLSAKTPLLGDPVFANDTKVKHQAMWRWQSLRDFSWPQLFGGTDGAGVYQPSLQIQYPQKLIMQGLEWNVPGHEHASIAILNQPDAVQLSNFEYQFDASDQDSSRTDLSKSNQSHQDALAGISYLASHFPQASYVVINHPSRNLAYTPADIRDMINAGPQIVLGLEGMPGHQKSAARGEYERGFFQDAENTIPDTDRNAQARTYGGADPALAKVGGLMDSLWGEGRSFWIFANSDFHNPEETADFYPGEYAKTYMSVQELTQTGIYNGMASGNLFIVQGDLIQALDFHVSAGDISSTLGQTLQAPLGADCTVTIRFKSPEQNNHGEKPLVNHVDLIAGDVTGLIPPPSAAYASGTNPSARVVATFTDQDWHTDTDGFQSITFTLPKLDRYVYLRLRGTNLKMNVENQTQDGNPLSDELIGPNNAAQAYADLWFYSNPIFISVK